MPGDILDLKKERIIIKKACVAKWGIYQWILSEVMNSAWPLMILKCIYLLLEDDHFLFLQGTKGKKTLLGSEISNDSKTKYLVDRSLED